MNTIIVIGGGGHAKVLISILKKLDRWTVAGYTDVIDRGNILGAGYLGGDSVLERMSAGGECVYAAMGLGHTGAGAHRRELAERLRTHGIVFPSIVSPRAVVNEGVAIGDGAVVFDGVVINTGSTIGMFAIVNTGSVIEHDCTIGDFTHIAPGAVVCGGVTVKNRSMVGAGATVLQYKEIGDNCLIGAGAVVTKDCLDGGVYAGVPATLIRSL